MEWFKPALEKWALEWTDFHRCSDHEGYLFVRFKLSNEGNGNLSFTYTKANSSDLVWFRIRWDGNEEQLWWNQERNEWSTVQLQPANECEAYNKCGSFGNCFATESPIAVVSKGLCRRMRTSGVEEIGQADSIEAANGNDCEEECLKNCSCNAYAFGAWDLWDSGKAMELIDPSVAGSCYPNEALRCIHVAMLCVQDSAGDRPTMSSVVLMLESENATLPMPRQPTFTSMRSSRGVDVLKENQDVASSNDVTISLIIGR
ncbi:hypothetical protein C3L33_06350, partial [Rhododendron williamsianum]